MHPFVVRIDDLHIWLRAYPALIGLAALLCLLIGPRWAAAREGLDKRLTFRIMLIVGAATFVVGHVHYLLNTWQFVRFHMSVGRYDTLLWSGLHAGGAVIGLVAASLLTLRWYGIPAGRFGDALVPTIGLGIAVARLGCFLEGCCYGTPCALPWCLSFPKPSNVWDYHRVSGLAPYDALWSSPVHPLQLYFAAVGLLIMASGIVMQRRKHYDGQITLVALLIFSLSSAYLEGFRQDFGLRAYWGTMPQLTWVALAMTAVAALALLAGELRHRLATRHRTLTQLA